MDRVIKSAPHIDGLVPYDPKYMSVDTLLSANEYPLNLSEDVRRAALKRIEQLAFNRYPDPLANELRECIAAHTGLQRDQILISNGGDELLFNLFLAWGGPGRTLLNFPPTFSVYASNAHITGTSVIDVLRRDDFSIDRVATLAAIKEYEPSIILITSPNNPTGNCVDRALLEEILQSTDALVFLDEAYIEFAASSCEDLLFEHENLAILKTFSKAFALAGVRLGYMLSSVSVIQGFLRVRQPYSVDGVSQILGEEAYRARDIMESHVAEIKKQRELLAVELATIEGVEVFPSEANYLLVRFADAHQVWENLYERYSVLVRDFSATPGLENCLRITVGTASENERLLAALRSELEERKRA
jgi:histidinol-phosphate aminotransferase